MIILLFNNQNPIIHGNSFPRNVDNENNDCGIDTELNWN